MRRALMCTVLGLALCGAWSCGDEDSGNTPDPVENPGLVWAVGTMGGLKAIDMSDTVVRAVNLGYDLYGLVCADEPYVFIGDGMTPGVKRISLLSDTTDTIEQGTSTVTAALGRAVAMTKVGDRVWVIGRGSKTLLGIDPVANVTDIEIALAPASDTGGCASMTALGGTVYVLTRRPLTVHAVSVSERRVVQSLNLETTPDSTSVGTIGAGANEVYAYIADRKEIVVVNTAATAEIRRVSVQGVERLDERMCAGPLGVYITDRSGSDQSLLRINLQSGAVDGRLDLAANTESLSLAKTFGNRLLVVIINSVYGQNAVIELDPTTMATMHRVEHVYVSDISVSN